MTIVKELAALRAGYPGCLAIVFADLTTSMVLASNTAEKTTQEKLDALCEAAQECLLGAEAAGLSGLLEDAGAATPTMVWRAVPDGMRCYLKLPAPAGEALCIALRHDVPIDRLSADAAALLSRIAGD
ncbi:MAG: hypothetical protein AAF999_06470 [Pseudomonadota bacterium]